MFLLKCGSQVVKGFFGCVFVCNANNKTVNIQKPLKQAPTLISAASFFHTSKRGLGMISPARGLGAQCQQLKMLRFPVNCAAIHLGAPSIAGRPSPKNDPPDRFIGFTPAELLKQGISHSAECDQRAPPFGNLRAFEKARPKLLFRLRRVRLKLLALRPQAPRWGYYPQTPFLC